MNKLVFCHINAHQIAPFEGYILNFSSGPRGHIPLRLSLSKELGLSNKITTLFLRKMKTGWASMRTKFYQKWAFKAFFLHLIKCT